jgi:sulfate transport system ATP-binding protein
VRPHDVDLERQTPPGAARAGEASAGESAVATAKVERLSRIGFMVKIELRLSDGQPLSVELTKDRVAELGLAEGDGVFVNLRDAKLFVQDYAI